VPYQVLPCKDGFLMIGAANDRQVRETTTMQLFINSM
jgi:crotonobetainyl-CoA:carnitine CoA-transferase CaiB-like acyl-CoA transferase